MAHSYLTVAEYRLQADMPGEFIDEIEARYPGYIDSLLQRGSAFIDSRLAKRYPTPFKAPFSVQVQGWLADLITPRVWRKRGAAATEEIAQYERAEEDAKKELAEAANGDTGLFDLPGTGADDAASGVRAGFPMAYSEQSPYVANDLQREVGSEENRTHRGTLR